MRRAIPSAIAAVFLLGRAAPAADEAPAIHWENIFGGPNVEYGKCVQETKDGGFILCGTTFSSGKGPSDLYLVRTDSAGRLLWQGTYGDSAGDLGFWAEETRDGGFIACGFSDSYRSPTAYEPGDIYLIRTDPSGNLLWEKIFGTDDVDSGYAITETEDGGIAVAGHMGYSAVLLKTDKSGNLLWTKTYPALYLARSLQETGDGGFIIAGNGLGTLGGGLDISLLRTDSGGEPLWEKSFGGIYYDEYGFARETSNDGYIVTGSAVTPDGEDKLAYLAKTDAQGELIWEQWLGGGGGDAYGLSAQEMKDGGFFVAGLTASGGGNPQGFIAKTDPWGNILWEKPAGGSGYDGFFSAQETSDGGIIASGDETSTGGLSSQNIYLVKFGPGATAPAGQIWVPGSFTASCEASIPVLLRTYSPGVDSTMIRSFSFGLSFDPAKAALLEVGLGRDIAASAEFFRADTAPVSCSDGRTGFTVNVLMTWERPFPAVAGKDHLEAIQCRFRSKGRGETALEFVDCLGDPAVSIFLSDDRLAMKPDARGGLLRFEGICFIRGDANSDGGLDISDPVKILYHLFVGEPISCLAACDPDGSNEVDISDPVYVLDHLFLNGDPPPAPYPDCGGSRGPLPCADHPPCR